MKCAVCGNKIAETFLNKRIGTVIRKGGKKHDVCSSCQKSLVTKEKILEKI